MSGFGHETACGLESVWEAVGEVIDSLQMLQRCGGLAVLLFCCFLGVFFKLQQQKPAIVHVIGKNIFHGKKAGEVIKVVFECMGLCVHLLCWGTMNYLSLI